MLIDTHAHLTTDRFQGHLDEILVRAREAGVGKIVSIACDLDDSQKVIDLADRHEEVFATVGVHPCYVHEVLEEDWDDRARHALCRARGRKATAVPLAAADLSKTRKSPRRRRLSARRR